MSPEAAERPEDTRPSPATDETTTPRGAVVPTPGPRESERAAEPRVSDRAPEPEVSDREAADPRESKRAAEPVEGYRSP